MHVWEWPAAPARVTVGAGVRASGEDPLAEGSRAARTVECEIARLRAWARRGDSERALRALDGALRALADLDAAAARTPEWRPRARALRAELDALIR